MNKISDSPVIDSEAKQATQLATLSQKARLLFLGSCIALLEVFQLLVKTLTVRRGPLIFLCSLAVLSSIFQGLTFTVCIIVLGLLAIYSEQIIPAFWKAVRAVSFIPSILFAAILVLAGPVLFILACIIEVNSTLKTGMLSTNILWFLKGTSTQLTFYAWIYGLIQIWKEDDYSFKKNFPRLLKAILLTALITAPAIGVHYWSTHGRGAVYFSSDDDYIR